VTTGPQPASASNPVEAHHLKWLALIRYQALAAEEQSRQPPPLSALALNHFQDTVEAMLGLVAEHNVIPRAPRLPFEKLFDAVAGVFPTTSSSSGQVSGVAGQGGSVVGATAGSTGGSSGRVGTSGGGAGGALGGASASSGGLSPDDLAQFCNISRGFAKPEQEFNWEKAKGGWIELRRHAPIQLDADLDLLVSDYDAIARGKRVFLQLQDEIDVSYGHVMDSRHQLCDAS
jgi:hypothetical protein